MFLIYRLLNLTGSAALPLPALHTAEEKAAGKQKLLVFSLLVLYMQLVYRIVGLPGAAFVHWSPKMNWIPFRDLGERRYLFQTSMNVVMFIPLGIFLPLLWPRYRRVSRIACTGAMVSLMIELLQMFSCRVTDVDDLIMNTLGAVTGFLLVRRWAGPTMPGNTRNDAAEFWCTNLLMVIISISLHPLTGGMPSVFF